jgi:hypothetical protein
MIIDLIVDFVDCNIPAVFEVGSMVAVGKLDDAWQMPVQIRFRWKPFLSSFPPLFCAVYYITVVKVFVPFYFLL